MSDKQILKNIAMNILCSDVARNLVAIGKADEVGSLIHREQKVELIKLIRNTFYYDESDNLVCCECEDDKELISKLIYRGYTVTYEIEPENKLGLAESKRIADWLHDRVKFGNVDIVGIANNYLCSNDGRFFEVPE